MARDFHMIDCQIIEKNFISSAAFSCFLYYVAEYTLKTHRFMCIFSFISYSAVFYVNTVVGIRE
jgi:hypothetical protein